MSSRRLIITVAILAFLVAGGVTAAIAWRVSRDQGAQQQQQTTQPEATPRSSEDDKISEQKTYPINVYFSKHPESDNDPTKVFPVDRVSPDASVANYAITQLIAGPTPTETGAGYFSQVRVRSEPSNCGDRDFALTISNEVATLQFCRTFDAVGTIADAQADQTIQATLKQFPTVKKVVILGKDGHCQFDLSGEDRCKQ